jgi:hypothetical protein
VCSALPLKHCLEQGFSFVPAHSVLAFGQLLPEPCPSDLRLLPHCSWRYRQQSGSLLNSTPASNEAALDFL